MQAILCPIRTDHKSIPELVIVIGLNSRRTYNRSYSRWVEELCRSLSSGLSTVKNLAREQRHLANLRKLDQAKTAFFTGVSHELRSPLTLIAGPASDALMVGEWELLTMNNELMPEEISGKGSKP